MVNPPEADILLLRRQTRTWTKEQRERLADGIRDSKARHILLEFKYTESVNEKALQQTAAYDYFYKSVNHLSDKQVQSFLISSKTPHSAALEVFYFQRSDYKGVYFSKLPLLRQVILIVLNELSDESHNAWIKCFASRKQEKRKAFAVLKELGLVFTSLPLEYLLSGLWKNWLGDIGEIEMSTEELTVEKVMEMGKFWGESYLSLLNPEQRLAGLGAKERLAGLGAKERLAGLNVKEIVSEVQHQKLLAELSVEEIEAYLLQVKK